MAIDFCKNLKPIEKLEIRIRKEFQPKRATIEDMAQNIIDCYEYDLEDTEKEFFKVSDDVISDIMFYVKTCGGFRIFDFAM